MSERTLQEYQEAENFAYARMMQARLELAAAEYAFNKAARETDAARKRVWGQVERQGRP